MKHLCSIIVLSCLWLITTAQNTIIFYTQDSVRITADQYLKEVEMPYIVFFHQLNSSRGEYKETAARFMNLGYNCLVVDLRTGAEMKVVPNETALYAAQHGLSQKLIDAQKDINAAIFFAYNKNKKPVILVGSTFSASLALIAAKNNPKIKAVIAFSPGEYFDPFINVKTELAAYDKPVFIAGSKAESKNIVMLSEPIATGLKTMFISKQTNGIPGAKILWKENKASSECWLELLMFFKKLAG